MWSLFIKFILTRTILMTTSIKLKDLSSVRPWTDAKH